MPKIDSSHEPSGLRRLPELDAVRGIASLSVVLLHFYDMWAPNDSSLLPHRQRIILLLLRPFYAGAEAVILFFVLSGLVLSLPYLRGRGQPYPVYLLRRVLRIYGPYLAALSLAVAGAAIWHGHPFHGEWAAVQWSMPVSPRLVVQHLAFLGVYDWAQYDFVIWSLIQEMRISLVFPFILFLVVRIGTPASILMGILLSCAAFRLVPASPGFSAWYSLGISIHYTACFIVGILLASRLDAIAAWWRRSSSSIHAIVAAASLLAYAYGVTVTKRVLPLLFGSQSVSLSEVVILSSWITMIGVAGLLILALNALPVRRLLNRPASQFFGKISYSLYLTHPTVLFALTFSCRNRVPAWLQFPIYLVVAVLFAWAFFLLVERNLIQWSRAVGNRVITPTSGSVATAHPVRIAK